MSDNTTDCRAVAARCLAAVHKGLSLNQQLPLFEHQVNERDRALLKQLCYGVLRAYPLLLGISKQLLQKPIKAKDSDILMLILLGGYQLIDSRVPEHAAVSATVAATKSLKKVWAKSFVNGVLRQWQRQKNQLLAQLTNAETMAHPQWLHQAIESAWPSQAQSIQHQNNQHPPMTLRVNQQKFSQTAYLQLLSEAGIDASACPFANTGIRLTKATSVDYLPLFFEGAASVQDEAAQLAAPLLDLQPKQRILDACCAPGGKTCHILETQPALAEVVALDVNSERLKKVSQNLLRLQLHATLVSGDALTTPWWDGQLFDRILLDAPCSATGVIRRNPDIKLHRKPEDILQLAQLQLQLLTNLWQTLKPNGLLLYATCSILPDENENVIATFCNVNHEAEHLPIDVKWGIQRPFGRQLFPQNQGHDGFYYALLTKKTPLCA